MSGWGILINQLCLFFVICFPYLNTGHVNIRPEFVPYVYKFITKAHSVGRGVDLMYLDIDFGDTSKIPVKEKGYIVIGYCEQAHSGPKIVINEKWWKAATDTSHELLIFHEAGHCLLQRDHTDGTDSRGDALSVMNWAIISDRMYESHYDYYIWELFTQDVHQTPHGYPF